MTEESVFLIVEGWLIPGEFELFKKYRMKILDILEKYNPQYLFYSHAFEWVFNDTDEEYPTGIEVIEFKDEKSAKLAISELSAKEIKEFEKKVFKKVRCYLSRLAKPKELKL
ncbi:MAG: hypothetical protein OEZ22_11995 [Spirochaetia bacterium]|nr:hypothetical protein [Spirochaetia bacterium]